MPVVKGKMPAAYEERIRRNYAYLLKEVDAEEIVPELVTGGVFNFDDQEEICSQDSRKKKTRKMVDVLIHSGPKAYLVFLEALGKHYSHVANILKKTPKADATTVDVATMTEKPPDDSEYIEKVKPVLKKLCGKMTANICKLQDEVNQRDMTISELKEQNKKLQDENLDLQLQNAENQKDHDRELAVMKRKMDVEHPAESLPKKTRTRNDCECHECPPQLKGLQAEDFHRLIDKHNGCLTRGKHFIKKILDKDALEAHFQIITGEDLYYPPQPRNFRYAARRVFVRLAYGVLGTGNRVKIPDCVERAIWDKYPG